MNDKIMVDIMGKKIERIEYKGQAVLTLGMIDELHQRPDGAARKAFNYHKNKFIEKEDFFDVPYQEWSQIPLSEFQTADRTGQRNSIKLLTLSGYLMLVKTFNDERAWQVQRALVRNYFVAREFLRYERNPGQYEQSLLKDAVHLLDIVCKELEYIREERNDLREKLLTLQERLIAKGATHPKATQPAASFGENEDDAIRQFLNAWWEEYGDAQIGVAHLYPLIATYQIPLDIGGGTNRSRRIRLGRKLVTMCNRQFGDYMITKGKKFHNVKRYKLQMAI